MPEITHEDNPMTVFKEMVTIFQAEASNHERITKTKDKMQAKIDAGYYPGNVRFGYKKTDTPSFHEPMEPTWSLLREAMASIASGQSTLDEALKNFNERHATSESSFIDMERFKRILREPYYSGAIKMSDWRVNTKGLHKPMITPEQHQVILRIVDGKKKKFLRKRHNPKYPLSNVMECTDCLTVGGKYPRLVGYDHSNGKKGNSRKVYEKYLCRSCKTEFKRQEVHQELSGLFSEVSLHEDDKERFMESLRATWRKNEEDTVRHKANLQNLLNTLKQQKNNLVLTLVSDTRIKEDIEEALEEVKRKIAQTECAIREAEETEKDMVEFIEFSLGFADGLAERWWELEHDDQVRCKQMIFPRGFSINNAGKVCTPEISPIFRLAGTEKARVGALNSNMEVHSRGFGNFYCEFAWPGNPFIFLASFNFLSW